MRVNSDTGEDVSSVRVRPMTPIPEGTDVGLAPLPEDEGMPPLIRALSMSDGPDEPSDFDEDGVTSSEVSSEISAEIELSGSTEILDERSAPALAPRPADAAQPPGAGAPPQAAPGRSSSRRIAARPDEDVEMLDEEAVELDDSLSGSVAVPMPRPPRPPTMGMSPPPGGPPRMPTVPPTPPGARTTARMPTVAPPPPPRRAVTGSIPVMADAPARRPVTGAIPIQSDAPPPPGRGHPSAPSIAEPPGTPVAIGDEAGDALTADDGAIPREASAEPSQVVEVPLESQIESPTVLDRALEGLGEQGLEQRAEALAAQLDAATERSVIGGLAYELGELCERRLADEARAVKAFGRALQSDPSLRPNLWAIRRVFYRRGLWPNLVKLIDAEVRFARNDRERADLMVEKALLLADRMDQRVDARAALEKAAALDPSSLVALAHLERLLLADGAGEPEALAHLWQAMAEAAASPARKVVYLLDLIRHHADQGEEGIERAQELVSSAVALGADVERVAVERLRIAELAGDPDGMLAALEAQIAQLQQQYGPAGVPDAAPRQPGQPPDRATALRLRMVALRRRQAQVARGIGEEPERAWGYLQQALALAPGEPLVLADLADIAEQLGRFEELAELVQGWGALEADPARSLALSIRRADALLRGGQREQALAVLGSLSSVAPGFIAVTALAERDALGEQDWRALAAAWSAAADAARLGTTFGPGSETAPDPMAAAAYYVAAADVYADLVGDLDEARARLGQALETVRGHGAALEALVELHERAGRSDEAAALLELHSEAGAVDERRGVLERLVGLYRELGRLDDALSAEQRLLQLDPNDIRLRWRLAATQAALGRHAERAALLADIAERQTDPARQGAVLLEAARLADEILGDGERAAALYRKALDVAPPGEAVSRYARAALADVLRRAGRWEELVAERRAEAGEVEDGPALVEALREAAAVLERRLDRPRDAAGLYQALLDRAPQEPHAMLGLARTRAAGGEPERALGAVEEIADAVFEQAAAGAGPAAQVEWLLRLGLAQELAGRDGDALDTYRRVLTMAPDSAMAALGIAELAVAAGDTAARIEALSALADSRSDAGLRADLHEQIGWLWALVLEDFERAADAFQSAIAADPARKGPLLGLALVAARRGEGGDVGDALTRLAAVVPNAQAASAMLLRAGAIADYSAARAGGGGDHAGGNGAAKLHARIKAALAVAPDDAGTLVVAAEYLATAAPAPARTDAEADALFERADLLGMRAALAANPSARDDWELDRAETLEAAGRLKEAGHVVSAVLHGRPGHLRALELLRRLCRRGNDRGGLARASLALARAIGDGTAKLALWREAAAILDDELGELKAAVPVYRRILGQEPGARQLDRLAAIYRSHGDIRGLVEILGDRLNWLDQRAEAGDEAAGRAAVPLLLERAQLRGVIGDSRGAARDLDALLSRAPNGDERLPEALSRRAELALSAGDSPRAAELYRRYLGVESHAGKRAEAELTLARVLADDMDDIGGAVEQIERVVAAQPNDVAMRERLIQLATRAMDWQRVAREIREIERLRGTNPERARDELRVAGVYRDRVGDRIKARQALERARQLDPLNIDAVRELAELVASDDPGRRLGVLQHAARDVRAAIADNPDRAALYERLSAIAHWMEDEEARHYALAALDALGTLSAEQRQQLTRSRAAVANQGVPRKAIGAAEWRSRLTPAVAVGPTADVWRVIAPAVAAASGLEPAKLGFGRGDKLAIKNLGRRFEAVAAALECVGVKDVEIHVSEQRAGVARALAGDQPILLLGADVAGAVAPEARFLLGRAVVQLDGSGIAADLRDDEVLLWFGAAARLAEAQVARDGAIAEVLAGEARAIDDRLRFLQKHMSRRDRKLLGGLAARFIEIDDPLGWRRAALAVGHRAGLLFAGDLAVALEVMDIGRGGRSLVDSIAGLDLLSWAVGDHHLELRRMLGLGGRSS